MNESEAILVVERGPVPGQRFPLQLDQVTLGRSAGNDLVLADPEISRRHLRVVRRADGFAVEDMGSTNGTFVNGQRINHLTLLQDGDTIDLGDTVKLRFISLAPVPEVEVSERPTQVLRPFSGEMAQAPASPPTPVQPVQAMMPPAGRPTSEPLYIPPPTYATAPPRRGRGLLIGCGLIMALLLVCAGTFLVLDSYQQGRLLYCGALRPAFEFILGPFGFAPLCP